MTDLERTITDGIDRLADIEAQIADLVQLVGDQHTNIQLLSARAESQYNLLAGRIDAAAEAVANIRRRLDNLEAPE